MYALLKVRNKILLAINVIRDLKYQKLNKTKISQRGQRLNDSKK
jgi:hypothetical protein